MKNGPIYLTVDASEFDEEGDVLVEPNTDVEKYRSLSSSSDEERVESVQSSDSESKTTVDHSALQPGTSALPELQRKLRQRNKKNISPITESSSDFDDVRDKDFVQEESESENTGSSEYESDDQNIHVTVLPDLPTRQVITGPRENELDDQDDTTNLHDLGNQSLPVESESDEEINVMEITDLFRKKLKRYGISQRQAAKEILKCSQSNLSEAFTKAKRKKSSKNMTSRGMDIFRLMDTWNRSKDLQRKSMQDVAQQRSKL